MTPLGSPGTVGTVLERLLAKWVVLVAFALAGALVALAYSATRPPRYEAKAVLGISISYAVTESLELVVEDQAFSRVSGLLQSDDVLTQALESLPQSIRDSQGWHQPAELRRNLRLDPRLAQWELVTVHEDPALAAEVSQAWAEAAMQALAEATAHAWRATALIGQKLDVECRPATEVQGGISVFVWDCRTEPPLEDPALIEQGLINEISLSRGILPDLTYELLQDATPPEEPILWARGFLAFAGLLAGLLIGVGFILWRSGTRSAG